MRVEAVTHGAQYRQAPYMAQPIPASFFVPSVFSVVDLPRLGLYLCPIYGYNPPTRTKRIQMLP